MPHSLSVTTDEQLQSRVTNVIYSLNILRRFLDDGVMPSEIDELEPVIADAIREVYRLRGSSGEKESA